MSERVTIKSIAKDLGISHMTVSRALSNHPNVHKDTRDTIIKRAKELGYVKSAAAKAMRGDATQIVGLLLPNIVNEFYARFANSMAQACEEHSLHLLIHLTNDDIEQERQALDRLREVQAMAVVMVPSPDGEDPAEQNVSGMKVIQLIRQRRSDTPTAAILVDDHDAIRDAVVYLAQHGHRTIGYIGANSELSSGRERLKAYLDGLEQAGLTGNPELVHTDAPSFEMGQACAKKLLDAGLATGIVCGGVEISNGALSALMDCGLQPGKDFAFVGYGDPSFYAWVGGGISTVRLPVERLAYQAVELLGMNWETCLEQEQGIRKFKADLTIR